MKSNVADATKAAQRERFMQLSPTERVERTLELGRRSAEMYAQFHGVSVADARAALRANKERGLRR